MFGLVLLVCVLLWFEEVDVGLVGKDDFFQQGECCIAEVVKNGTKIANEVAALEYLDKNGPFLLVHPLGESKFLDKFDEFTSR